MNALFRLIRFVIAWFRIPKGVYCYSGGRGTGRCPYWRRIKDRPDQEDGWCDYLGKGDTEIKSEGDWIITYSKIPEEIGKSVEGISLLWDQCKECGIKDEQ